MLRFCNKRRRSLYDGAFKMNVVASVMISITSTKYPTKEISES